jgi:diguanylate cyclase
VRGAKGWHVRGDASRVLAPGDKVHVETAVGTTILKLVEGSLEPTHGPCRCDEGLQHDGLTHVLSKRSIADAIKAAFADGQGSMSLLLVDIDRLQQINAVHGHRVGDAVLQEVARVIEESVGEHGIVGRSGGDKFAVVLPTASMDNAGALAERVRRAVERHAITVEQTTICATVSVGAATLHEQNYEKPKAMVMHADEAVFSAKRRGRNRAVHASTLQRVVELP